jgi:hypothetical protein
MEVLLDFRTWFGKLPSQVESILKYCKLHNVYDLPTLTRTFWATILV